MENSRLNQQREKPGITPQELNAAVGLPLASQTRCSGGMIENFREGWAVAVFNSLTVHYFRRTGFDTAKALCGFTIKMRWLYGPGNFSTCKKCKRKI